MWPVRVAGLLLLLSRHGCLAGSGGGDRPHFVSRNFNNVLHWKSHQDRVGEVYSVRYWSDLDITHRWKAECQNITSLSCDLTAETPSVYDVHYIAEVLANGLPLGHSHRFKPIAETVLGPPILSISPTLSSLNVNVTLPMGPNKMSILDIFNRTKRQSFNPPALYYLHITHPPWAVQTNISTTGRFVIKLKNNNTEYRGYVTYIPTLERGRNHSEHGSFQETLPGDPQRLYALYIVVATVLVAPVLISAVLICRYINGGKKQSIPAVLLNHKQVNKQPQVMPDLDKSLSFSKPVVCPHADKEVSQEDTVQVKPKVPSEGYSPQGNPCQDHPWDSGSSMGSPPAHQDTSDQSTIYSEVIVQMPRKQVEGWCPATSEDRSDINLPWFSGPKNPMPPRAESSPIGPLFLPTIRDSNGQIQFSMLTFQAQMQSSTEDSVSPFIHGGQPHLSDLVDSGERPPLLSLLSMGDSESSDSGYDQGSLNTLTPLSFTFHDSLSQPLLPAQAPDCQTTRPEHVTFESGYKQNGMPTSWGYKGQ